MKCLVFSDSHGSYLNMQSALRMHRDAQLVFFLGDGLSDAEALSEYDKTRAWYFVRGNCDFRGFVGGVPVGKTEEIVLFSKKIVITHGDLYGVKYSREGLLDMARSRLADIVLYGHTHIASEEYVDGIYLFNPGSARASYGILTIDENNVLFSHGAFL